jgi:predicted peptidase
MIKGHLSSKIHLKKLPDEVKFCWPAAMKASTLTKMPFVFIVFLILLNIVSVDAEQEDPVMLLKITELKSGMKLRYTLSLPRSLSLSKPYPLVVALHYGGKVTPFYSKDFVMSFVEPALHDLDAIFVAPDCPATGWTNAVSETAVLELILLLMEEYNIDSGRIVLLGYSMGGSGTWYMAAKHPDLFSAAIPMSAPAEPSATPVIEDVPLLIIHGELDELFPVLEVKKLYEKQKAGGAEIQLMIVEKTTHHQLFRFVTPLRSTIPWIKKIWEER